MKTHNHVKEEEIIFPITSIFSNRHGPPQLKNKSKKKGSRRLTRLFSNFQLQAQLQFNLKLQTFTQIYKL